MAGDWIKVEKELHDKPEVRRMARALRLSRFDIVGRLVSVWSWADSHSFTGSGMDISEEDIDDIADLIGFADALRQVGWLKGRAASLEFPNFGRHNGQSAKRRAMEAERKRLERMGCSDDADKRPQRKRTKFGQNADQRREEKNLSPFLPPPCTVEEVEAHLRAAAFAGRVRLAPDQIPDCATAYISKRDLTDWKRGEIPITAAKWKSDSINFAVSYSANHPAQPGTDKDPYSNLEEL